MNSNYLANGWMTYMPEELDTALVDRQNMIEAGRRTLRAVTVELFPVNAHVRDQDGNSLVPARTGNPSNRRTLASRSGS